MLKEEMDFLKAYRYLLDIKYEEKLQFHCKVTEEEAKTYKLPAFSLQPLIENIIKHNVISRKRPVDVTIYIEDELLIVENTFQPVESTVLSSGIGLANLDNRYYLLTSKHIHNYISDSIFVVKLPLVKVNIK